MVSVLITPVRVSGKTKVKRLYKWIYMAIGRGNCTMRCSYCSKTDWDIRQTEDGSWGTDLWPLRISSDRRFIYWFGLNVFKFESNQTPKDHSSQALRYKYQLLKKCCLSCVSSEKGKPNESKKLSELEPFTDYSCTGQIKKNNITVTNTTAVPVWIKCGMLIFTLPQCSDENNKLIS